MLLELIIIFLILQTGHVQHMTYIRDHNVTLVGEYNLKLLYMFWEIWPCILCLDCFLKIFACLKHLGGYLFIRSVFLTIYFFNLETIGRRIWLGKSGIPPYASRLSLSAGVEETLKARQLCKESTFASICVAQGDNFCRGKALKGLLSNLIQVFL